MTTATRKHTNGLRITANGDKAHRRFRVETTSGRPLTAWTPIDLATELPSRYSDRQNERRLPMENKAMTLRLPAEQAEALEKVAEVDGVSVTEAIREAIEQHISSRAADKEFRARLAASMERHQRILDRLSKA